jgi:hypothetical protein
MPTLSQLQASKDEHEAAAVTLRQRLRELARIRLDNWAVEFERVQDELIAVTGEVGLLSRQICTLVED